MKYFKRHYFSSASLFACCFSSVIKTFISFNFSSYTVRFSGLLFLVLRARRLWLLWYWFILNYSHNKREQARQAKLIIKMEGACTWIQDPDNLDEEPKQFRFDHSYWSFDGFTEREADGYLEPCTPKYADQVL